MERTKKRLRFKVISSSLTFMVSGRDVCVVAINIRCVTSRGWLGAVERSRGAQRPQLKTANNVFGDGVIKGSNPESDESREVRRAEEPDRTEGMNISACRPTP